MPMTIEGWVDVQRLEISLDKFLTFVEFGNRYSVLTGFTIPSSDGIQISGKKC